MKPQNNEERRQQQGEHGRKPFYKNHHSEKDRKSSLFVSLPQLFLFFFIIQGP